ncbi:unnamed protein product [Lepeophtheirus salmonis]|uniref:(salmon louse) hypothetical protein n=1 Tax=Lepeophtheirus salmonis TaxID=72036 RepID=A0A0K2TLZ6_LEPSM|nr:unnamed protein product [Lepeophtheirus salmonis]CAF2938858.1 unnamed protein product [Lepeophtheirus salmonis]
MNRLVALCLFIAIGALPYSSARSPPVLINPTRDISNSKIQKVALESTKFLYHLFDTSNACPLYVKDVIQAKKQSFPSTVYELELQVETNGADFDCDYVFKNCANIRVQEPPINLCPGNQFCLIPENLKGIDCVDINLTFN